VLSFPQPVVIETTRGVASTGFRKLGTASCISALMPEFRFKSGGVRLFAVENGDGEAIVMLHGGMADHRTALPFVASLSTRYRVIAPDLRGSGKSWSAMPLTFDQLADDVGALLDHVGARRAVVGGVSTGSGVALRFALRYPDRILALVVVTPVYAGGDSGYTQQQSTAFATMDSVASRAADEGLQVLRVLYANLPPAIQERAVEMLEGFDAASVVASSHFIASGAQPFVSTEDLRSLEVPTLLIRGNDDIHPAEISDLYAGNIRDCVALPAAVADVSEAIGAFCDQCTKP
jgi:pimeloyl-ACP methyl ester carboxylesterase